MKWNTGKKDAFREVISGTSRRLERYFLFTAQVLFLEKPRGLDFTMRDTGLFNRSEGRYHGYSKTNEKHLRDIFGRLDYSTERKLLDVGCGKGVVLKEASRFPFGKVAGIELQPELVRIARRNLNRLRLTDRVSCIQADAISFDGYGDYNVYFFFNPFSEEVMEKVMDRILESRGGRWQDAVFIYHNPRYLRILEERLPGAEKSMLYDRCKGYETCILQAQGR